MNRMEKDLADALRQEPVPDEREAEERGWRLVRQAYESRPPVSRGRLPWGRRVAPLALVALLVGALITPAGAQVRRWVADAISPGRTPSLPALTSLPSGGQLLVQSSSGAWVVHADGTKRLLGGYSDSTWSPHGLYVATARGHELAAVEPDGAVRWTLDGSGFISRPAWNRPDGFRVAYLSGSSLRVVNGDATRDHLLQRRVAHVTPTWMPGRRYILAFVRPDGAVEAMSVDDGEEVLRTPPGPAPESVQWTARGARLLIVRKFRLEMVSRSGRLLWRWSSPAGMRIGAAQLDPTGRHISLILRNGARSELLLVGPGDPSRVLFKGPGRFSATEWSPDAEWLLLSWKSADQWLFLNLKQPNKIVAVSNVSQQFNPGVGGSGRPFPTLRGWCCSS